MGCHYGNGRIGFWFDLLFYNEEYVHGVILHELCHTVHRNHLEGFWNMLTELLKSEGLMVGEHHFESFEEENGLYLLLDSGTTKYTVSKNGVRMFECPMLTKRDLLFSFDEDVRLSLIKTIINRSIKDGNIKIFMSL